MKLIPLTQGKFAQVDDEDFDHLMQWKWYARKSGHVYYALRNSSRKNGKRKTFLMHRVISNTNDQETLVDHRDRNGLNNQKNNIRTCTVGQNCSNKKSAENSTSKYIGVNWKKSNNKWVAAIKHNKKVIHIGVFNIEDDAAKAYNSAAKKYHGEFANLNIITS